MRNPKLTIAVLLAVLVVFLWTRKEKNGNFTNSDPSFERNIENIHYSRHARCRMDCRHIDESEVKEILKEGVINNSKTAQSSKGKTYPLEGITHDGQRVRIVFAPHGRQVTVVTVIDLDKEWPCDCN